MHSTSKNRKRPPPRPDIERALHLAMQEHQAGRFEAAQGHYQAVLSAQPRHPDALHLCGVLHAQLGRHDRAAELIAQAIGQDPREPMFHNNFGNVHMERGRFEQAEAAYQRALELDDRLVDALNNLGVLWSNRGRPDEAERALRRAIQLSPGFMSARLNLANHHLRSNRAGDAVQVCREALQQAPLHAGLREALAKAHMRMDRAELAHEVFQEWLALEPDNPQARYLLAACTGDAVPDRAPDAYIKDTFDAFAGSFDAKLAALGYQAPARAAEAVARRAAEPGKTLRVLDAGCGTGLCGPLLAPFASHLTGVDLSQGMLRNAHAHGVYDRLVQGELVAFLDRHPCGFDVIVSTDTLIYFGALEAFAAAARAALRAGGQLSFSVEAHDDADGLPAYRLQANGRYSHRRTYIERVVAGAGLEMFEMQSLVVRTELGAPVAGWLVTALAPASG
ncbi:MAG: tetratricopeptide repeat protein [Rubrivivax sp.]|nr:tetratricopeptide repeat protein [Rubrivivax sp.]